MTKVIEIEVRGPTGTGKSHVLAVIEAALREAYGNHTQVASAELSQERALLGNDSDAWVQPTAHETVFVLKEKNGCTCPTCQLRKAERAAAAASGRRQAI